MKAPVHTTATRRHRLAAAQTKAISSGSALAALEPVPPGSTRVSIRSPRPGSGTVPSSRPLSVRTGPPRADATRTRYPPRPPSDAAASPALANTSCGPTTSIGCTPSKATKTTAGSLTDPLSPWFIDGVNDTYPTHSAMVPANSHRRKPASLTGTARSRAGMRCPGPGSGVAYIAAVTFIDQHDQAAFVFPQRPWGLGGLEDQDELAHRGAALEHPVGVGGMFQREDFGHVHVDGARGDQPGGLQQRRTDQGGVTQRQLATGKPQIPDAAGPHPGGVGRHLRLAGDVAVGYQPPERCEQFEGPRPHLAAERVEHHVDALACRGGQHALGGVGVD